MHKIEQQSKYDSNVNKETNSKSQSEQKKNNTANDEQFWFHIGINTDLPLC